MQKLWCGIKAVGPHHRSRFVIDLDLLEVLGITQGLPQRSVQQEGAVNLALNTVVERHSQAMAV